MLIYTGAKGAGWHRKEDFIVDTVKGVPHYHSNSQSSSVVRLMKQVYITFLCGKGEWRSLPPLTRQHNWIHESYLRVSMMSAAIFDKASPSNCDGRGRGDVCGRTSGACLCTDQWRQRKRGSRKKRHTNARADGAPPWRACGRHSSISSQRHVTATNEGYNFHPSMYTYGGTNLHGGGILST